MTENFNMLRKIQRKLFQLDKLLFKAFLLCKKQNSLNVHINGGCLSHYNIDAILLYVVSDLFGHTATLTLDTLGVKRSKV